MTRLHVALVLIAVALSLPNPAAAQGAMTCNDHETLSTCSHYEPEAFAILGVEFYQAMCKLIGGSWGTVPCPAATAVGTCDDKMGSVTTYYSTGDTPYDAGSAKLNCAQVGGTFADVSKAPPSQTAPPPPSPISEPAPTSSDPAATAPTLCQRYEACCVAWAESMRGIDGYPESAIDPMKEACESIRTMQGLPGAEESCETALDAMREGAVSMAAYPQWELPRECL